MTKPSTPKLSEPPVLSKVPKLKEVPKLKKAPELKKVPELKKILQSLTPQLQKVRNTFTPMIFMALIAMGGQSCSKGDELNSGGITNAEFEQCNLNTGGFDGELEVAMEDVIANMDVRVEGPGSDDRSVRFTENGNQYEYNEDGKVGLAEFYEIIGSSDGRLDMQVNIDGATEDTRLILSADGQQDIWFDFDDLDCLPDLPEGVTVVGQEVLSCSNDGDAMDMKVRYQLSEIPGDGTLDDVLFDVPGAQTGSTTTIHNDTRSLNTEMDIQIFNTFLEVDYHLIGGNSNTDLTLQHEDAGPGIIQTSTLMNEGCEYVCPFEVGSSYGEIGHNGCDAEGKVDIVDCLAAAGPLKIKMRLESASGNDLNHKLKNGTVEIKYTQGSDDNRSLGINYPSHSSASFGATKPLDEFVWKIDGNGFDALNVGDRLILTILFPDGTERDIVIILQ